MSDSPRSGDPETAGSSPTATSPTAANRADTNPAGRTAALAALEAVQVLDDALDRTHHRLKSAVEMNASDVSTLRMLVIRERQGTRTTPQDIAEHLRLSTATVTTLLDRLAAAGHVRRTPHPADRRSRIVELTDLARSTFLRHFGGELRAMREVIEARDDQELAVITAFLGDIAAAVADPEDPTRRTHQTSTEEDA
ncbi:MarR family winged helix-turn-helix transcriptional regulator [Nesterenkonia sp. F]|uniref:MarR family winged helix-turn-helix transcriptional regulator n=1 Tax=Nesterenkonia sp. F TaxID=795955 RepID=UPI000255C9A5|nr:MarR family transcriptional regulator [Nesterenkonia sp. F]